MGERPAGGASTENRTASSLFLQTSGAPFCRPLPCQERNGREFGGSAWCAPLRPSNQARSPLPSGTTSNPSPRDVRRAKPIEYFPQGRRTPPPPPDSFSPFESERVSEDRSARLRRAHLSVNRSQRISPLLCRCQRGEGHPRGLLGEAREEPSPPGREVWPWGQSRRLSPGCRPRRDR